MGVSASRHLYGSNAVARIGHLGVRSLRSLPVPNFTVGQPIANSARSFVNASTFRKSRPPATQKATFATNDRRTSGLRRITDYSELTHLTKTALRSAPG